MTVARVHKGSVTGRYCRGCRYPLTSLTERRCPECGRLFDPDDPDSFLSVLQPPRPAGLLSWFGVFFFLVGVPLFLLRLAWVLYRTAPSVEQAIDQVASMAIYSTLVAAPAGVVLSVALSVFLELRSQLLAWRWRRDAS